MFNSAKAPKLRTPLLTILLGIVISIAHGQSLYRVDGTVMDGETNSPLEFANASLLTPSDSSLVAGATSDANGSFSIATKPGNYILKVQFISYAPRYRKITLSENRPIVNVGSVTLLPDSEILSEVVVTGQKDQMQLELDKRIFNVSANLQNVAANASEILDNLPSVAVDVEGNVSLRGNSNVRILVNGKPSGLVGISSPDALRQLQGDLIERIEVITNPSARYDAEGSAGIINIILKKEREHGLNGSFVLNTGYPQNFGFSTNLNYRKGRFNVFGSYGINYRENPGGGFDDRISRDTLFTFIENDRLRTGTSYNYRFGTDFTINDKNMISLSVMSRISDEDNFTDITYFDRTTSRGLINNTLRKELQEEADNNLEYQLNYKKEFNGNGHELTAQFQFRDNTETELSSIDSANLLLDTPLKLFQRSSTDELDRNVLMQLDYVYPFKKGKKFEAGYRGTLREIANDYIVEQIDGSGGFFTLPNFSNKFTYNEDVHALYSIYENKMVKWGYQVGLRVEQTNITTFQRETNETNYKDYLNAFPSAFVTYNLDNMRTLQASYSRRLSRPRFWYLNPFSSYSDPRNIRTGNTDLNPEYTDSYELGVLNNLKKSSVYVGGYYRYSTGVIDRIQTSVDGINTISTPRNIGIENAYGIEANFSTDPTDWLNLNGNANFYRAITKGRYNDITLDRDTYTARFRLNSKIKINKIDFQVSGNYMAPERQTQGTRKSLYYMDLGANMDVMKGKGTINLSVRDLFNSRKYRGTTITSNFTESSKFQWRSRQIRLSFSYRLNQKKKRERGGQRDDDFDDEEF
ncbi:MAG TPA: outer membrane beta-barrel family protein [Cyclobacteriaceae bacterium]|nr:outer membrane beta-barrel family protein [Cyclobacteriaceae bacterium]